MVLGVIDSSRYVSGNRFEEEGRNPLLGGSERCPVTVKVSIASLMMRTNFARW